MKKKIPREVANKNSPSMGALSFAMHRLINEMTVYVSIRSGILEGKGGHYCQSHVNQDHLSKPQCTLYTGQEDRTVFLPVLLGHERHFEYLQILGPSP